MSTYPHPDQVAAAGRVSSMLDAEQLRDELDDLALSQPAPCRCQDWPLCVCAYRFVPDPAPEYDDLSHG